VLTTTKKKKEKLNLLNLNIVKPALVTTSTKQ
jgi:hypothetical protein